jgi:hypothetical protein
MRKFAAFAFLLFTLSACSAGVYGRHSAVAVSVAPEWYGTVTYVDANSSRFDLDYYGGGRHYVRPVYFHSGTRWDGIRYTDVHKGDRIMINGRQHRGRWTAESIRRY